MHDTHKSPTRRHRFRHASLQRRMTAMLLVIVAQSLLFTGLAVGLVGVYLQSFNAIMTDVYDINQLLGAHTAEADDLRAYALERTESSYSVYLASRARTNRTLEQMDGRFAKTSEQYLLLQATRTSYDSFHAACDETVFKWFTGGDYAQAYDRALRIGTYIEGYIKTLLQVSIAQGQELYQRNMVRFRLLPVLFGLSIVLSTVCVALWTRWMLGRVVRPINRLIDAAADMRVGRYDAPDIQVEEADEISHLTQVVNEMKHSTAQLVDSLRSQREMESRLHEEEMRSVKMEATMDTLRLSLLQSQINPHFLFNTLNIISRMAQMEDAPVTEDLIVRLANLFRYNLQSASDIVPLTSELKIALDYITIQQIRFGERIRFTLDCTVDADACTVPIFTLQPLIENAVIHGIGPMEEGGSIEVVIRRADGTLRIAVADTGVGMSDKQVQALLSGGPDAKRHVTGLGLGNVRSRILGHYQGSAFSIDSRRGEGTRILITIPMEEERDDDNNSDCR